jgi:hypothetical protein
MPNERASELMYDTAATLRLLDAELGELAPRKPVETPQAPAPIRKRREQFRAAATERLSHSNEKLGEVSSTTESAAIDILRALERAIAKVDELETDDVLADSARGYAIRDSLREELFTVIGHMQFQDITSQQIMYVQSMLTVMEGRLADIAGRFDQSSGAAAPVRPTAASAAAATPTTPSTFDPNASLTDAETRQALADSLVSRSPRVV